MGGSWSTRAAAALATAAVLCACGGVPVRVEPAPPTLVQRELTANILNSGEPSMLARQALQRHGQVEVWRRDPRAALAELHRREGLTRGGFRMFALAELSYAHAQASGDRSYYLAAAVYAYTLLFPGDDERLPLEAADPRLRLACELYNRGLAEALRRPDDGLVEIAPSQWTLPFGTLEIAFDPAELSFGGYRFERFVPAADLSVRGLRNRYRRGGIGAPLVAALSREETRALETVYRRVPEQQRLPVTAFLRIAAPNASLKRGRFEARLELYSEDDALTVEVDGRDWPLEFETSSALASTLADSPWWDFELAGFLSDAVRPFRDEPGESDGLLLVHPYRPGRMPVVLVHGTASSPARWAELVNELEFDRDVWDRFQIWLYIYNTGNPVAYSAGNLRHALDRAVAELDPAGSDPALRRMVVIGHSQGGLLTKLLAVDSGDVFWRQASDVPLETLKMSDETRAILRRTAFFTPAPYVSRVIFVCTPHRGSYLAGVSLARLVSSLVSMPADLTARLYDVVTLNEGARVLNSFGGLPTSIDDMNPSSDFIRALAALPIAPPIAVHSIIAVEGDGPPEDGGDGVVRYESAHIEGVLSEKVVRSGHSAQANPDTIEEIRRILNGHAEASP
jgi:pimeloyl-ACP methyl ester carboxylesterase